MGLFSSERDDSSNIWCWTAVIVLAFATMSVTGQTNPSTQTPTPPAVQEKVTPATPPTAEDTETVSTAADVETQRHFDELRNELRRELLDDRADTVNWWLTATAIFLTFFGIVVVLGGYFSFSRFREIEVEARENVGQSKQYAEEAREIIRAINEQKKQAEEATQKIREMTSEAAHDPKRAEQVKEVVQQVEQNLEAPLVDRAIADAVSLQRAGKIKEAIEKWRSIANVAEGSDNDLAARAWLSVGYLLYERGGEDAGEQ